MKRKIFTTAIGLTILCGLLAANFFQSEAARDETAAKVGRAASAKVHGKTGDFDSKTPLIVRISMSDLPALHKPTEVFCTVRAAADAPGTTAAMILPADAVLISGTTSWKGDLNAGQSIAFSATIAFKSYGKKILRAVTRRSINADDSWGDMDAIYLYLGADKTSPGIYSPDEERELNSTQARPSNTVDSQLREPAAPLEYLDSGPGVPPSLIDPRKKSGDAAPAPNAPAGTVTVTGRWSHYGLNGFSTPSKFFLIQLRRASDGAHLAFAYTDSNGNFSVGPVTNPGNAGMKVRVWTYIKYDSASADDDELMIVPNGSSSNFANCFYSEIPNTYVFPDGTSGVGNWEITRDNPEGTNPNAHAWYIKDDLDRGYRFPPAATGDCTVEWRFDSTVGAYYIAGEHVHLTGDNRRSPDTIIHEMGHNVMYNVYGTFPSTDCPNPHFINGSSGLICAWTEGWADFYALVVNGDPTYTWDSGASLNLETPTWGTPNWDNGETVEGRVAGSLWDIYDSTNDGSDQIWDGFSHIWTNFSTHVDTRFRFFWDDMPATGIDTVAGADAIYQNTIDYRVACNGPGAFSQSSPTNGQVLGSTTSVTLTWGASANANSYDVYFGTTSNPPFLANQTGTSRSVTVTPGQTYWWKVVAKVTCGSATFTTAIWSFSVQSTCNPPGAFSLSSPSNGQVLGSTTSVNLTWGASANATSYDVYFGTNSNPPFLANQTGTSRLVTATPGQTYWWKVVAKATCTSTTVTAGIWSFSVSQTGTTNKTRFDYDGDHIAEIGVYRRVNGTWYIVNSGNGSTRVQQWGADSQGDAPIAGDFDGDGMTDIAVWRPVDGVWYIINSSNGSGRTQQWGDRNQGDIPTPADFDGDGKTDLAVWRAGNGTWYILNSSNGSVTVKQWGAQSQGDKPVAADYDGDGKADIAVWRGSNGTWYIVNSSNGTTRTQQWGVQSQGDVPVNGDFDADGKTDIAVWRSVNGTWYFINSSDGLQRNQQWGTPGDVPTAADFDGDGKADMAVWRPSNGTWYIINSSNGSTRNQQWGSQSQGDVPIPAFQK